MTGLLVFILMLLNDCCSYLSTLISYCTRGGKTMYHELYLCDMQTFSRGFINLYSSKYP